MLYKRSAEDEGVNHAEHNPFVAFVRSLPPTALRRTP
jgi:hypothetical protein